MNSIQQYAVSLKFLMLIVFVGLFFSGNIMTFNQVYISVCFFMLLRTVFSHTERILKYALIFMYLSVAAAQIAFCTMIIFGGNMNIVSYFICKLSGTIVIFVPFVLDKILSLIKPPHIRFHSPLTMLKTTYLISLAELKKNKYKVMSAIKTVSRPGKALSRKNIGEVISDLPRHNCFRYINGQLLTDDYFETAYASLNDGYIYIVISNTGSAASELVSVFTKKRYNHISLSFDKDLKTVISYNGGERICPPGLNREKMEFFNKKADSSIIVYKLKATPEQKTKIIEMVRQIDQEGSAYNLLGLVFKYSHKPNIMFCSQFVYKMLRCAGLAYFDKLDTEVRPTDLVELDYHRKLQFVRELHLNKPTA